MLVSLLTIVNEKKHLRKKALITMFFFTFLDSFLNDISIVLHDLLEGVLTLCHFCIDLGTNNIIFLLYNRLLELLKILTTQQQS